MKTALAALLLLSAAASAQVVIIDNDGRFQKGRSVLVASDGSVKLTTDTDPIALGLDAISEIVFEARKPEPMDKAWEIYLNSDDPRRRDILTGTPGDEVTKDHVRMSGTDAGEVDVPLVFAFALRSRQHGEPPPLDLRQDDLKSDEIIVRSGGESRDKDKGSLLSVSREAITFQSELFDAEKTYKLANVDRVLFAALKNTVELPGVVVTVSTRRGSRVTGKLVEMNDKICRVETSFRLKGKPFVLDLRADSVMSILVQNGNLVYLSDMTVTPRQTWTRGVEGKDPSPARASQPVYFLDRGVNSPAPASIRGVRFRKAISTRNHVELEFNLDGKFSRFSAVAGVSDEAQPTESAQPRMSFRVLADGKEVWAGKAATFETPGEEVKIDVKGVKLLVLVSEFEGYMDALTWGVWGDARVIK